jgi:ParB family transcriptional regulator, chromosome partitioning protein
MAKKVLGKGLMALLDDHVRENVMSERDVTIKKRIEDIVLSKITPNQDQPRKDFTDIQELAASILEKGILQPLLVRKQEHGYQIIAGERRFRAAQSLKLEKVPVIILEADEEEALELALIENVQRKDLNPVEEAAAYKSLMDRFNLSQEEVSRKVGKERSTVANALRILTLPKGIIEDVSRGTISAGHAKILASMKSEKEQRSWRNRIVKDSLSVRNLEDLFKDRKQVTAEKKEAKHPVSRDVFLKNLERSLEEFFSTKVRVRGNHRKGKIEMEYYSMDDLERIKDKIDR